MSTVRPDALDLPGLDLVRLNRWLAEHVEGAGPVVSARLLAGGKSNLTYALSDGSHDWVLRRPPLGHVLATAHDMVREHRVLTALHGTEVPVPRTVALGRDHEVLGCDFYLMEFVAGTAYARADQLVAIGAARSQAVAEQLLDTLATLHTIDPATVGLGDFGRPEGYLERQVRRWGQQFERSRTRDLAPADELHRLLVRRVPATSAASVVHGDYRLDNLLFDDRDRPVAVLDWEMATLGDPLTDIALMLTYDRLGTLLEGAPVPDVARAPGYPQEADLLARYATASGRDLADLGFHLGLAAFKVAVILEGIHVRHRAGQTVGPGFDGVGEAVLPLLESGLTALHTS